METNTETKQDMAHATGSRSLDRMVRVLALLLIAGLLSYINTHTEWMTLRVITGMGLGLIGWLLPDVWRTRAP